MRTLLRCWPPALVGGSVYITRPIKINLVQIDVLTVDVCYMLHRFKKPLESPRILSTDCNWN